MMFDLGQNDPLSPRELLALTDVFVTHCHIDHFVGFDRLLRVCLGRPARIRLYGPADFIRHVAARLGGYLWNLADRYDLGLELEVLEVGEGGRGRTATFRLVDGFAPSAEREVELVDGIVLDEDDLRVRVAILDHKTPCLGYVLEEKGHIGIKKNLLESRGWPVGPWLNEVKSAARAELADTATFDVPGAGVATLGQLRDCLVQGPGQRVAYLTDLGYTASNLERIKALAFGADLLFIESSFGAGEGERARDRFHLTTHQAGWIARHLEAARVIPFHLSLRHAHERDALIAEVMAAWRGAVEPGLAW